jgi:uncharacterized phage protein (TIGR02218 family)
MKIVSDEYFALETAGASDPAELYRIWRMSGEEEWTYTSADSAVVYGEKTYAPAAISRGAVAYDQSLDTSSLDITLDRVSDPAVRFVASHPVEPIWVQVLRVHRDQSPMEAVVVFAGLIVSVGLSGAAANIQCAGLDKALDQQIPTFRIQTGCNATPFDAKCALDPDDYVITGVTATVSADGLVLTATGFAEYADGYFTLGHISINGHRRMIVEHTGQSIRLRYPVPGMASGDAFSAWPGCDGTIETCRDKFNNVINFRGYPDLPTDNPSTWS